jgi:prepilin-type N-terminal cleavage/methylation domain-containing protein
MRKMRAKRCKSAFTLLEIVICLAIVTLLMGVVGVKIYQLVDLYRFRFSVQKMLFELNHWQILALTHRQDVAWTISKQNEEYVFRYETETPLSSPFASQKHALSNVRHLKLNGKIVPALQGMIYSTGRIEPEGILHFEPKEGISPEEALWIDLKYPMHSHSTEHKARQRNDELKTLLYSQSTQ